MSTSHSARLILAVGHSFGGVVAVNAAVGGIRAFEPVPFRKIAIIASPNSMPELFGRSASGLAWGQAHRRRLKPAWKPWLAYRLDTYVMGEQLKRFDGEVLVLHAPDDAEVAFGDAQAMANAGNHVRLVPMPGLGHRRIIADERVYAELSAFGGAEMIAAEAA